MNVSDSRVEAKSAKPFVKWAGGKAQLLPVILPLVQSQLEPGATYHEPFLGGGAVFFALRAAGFAGKAYLSDANADLINTYVEVAGYAEILIDALRDRQERNSQEYFYEVRGKRPGISVLQASRFIYLNKTCFNGLCRYNRAGEFNVPWGKYKNPNICDAENIRACAAALVRTQIEVQDFTWVLQNAKFSDVVYFDPPYVPVSKTSNFVGYSKAGFKGEDQDALEHVCTKLNRMGVKFVLSNSDCEETRALYRKWNVKSVEARRNVNSKGAKRGPVGELVATNF